MNSKVCIVIPTHKTKLPLNESNALKRVLELYDGKHDIFFAGPKSIQTDFYEHEDYKIPLIKFSDWYFSSNKGYNYLLVKPQFYKPFLGYDYMFLYQLDTFIFHDSLLKFCDWGYDYIGAPWTGDNWMKMMDKRTGTKFFTWFFNEVGNGGFSLRNCKKAYRIAKWFTPFRLIFWRKKWHEDLFWSTFCLHLVPGYKVAPTEKALQFAVEDSPVESIQKLGGKLPFGCHAWEKNSPEFWIPHFQSLGYTMEMPKP